MDQHSLLDEDETMATSEQNNVFSDDFEDDSDCDMVADGFRPGAGEGPHIVPYLADAPVRALSTHSTTHSTIQATSADPSRSSTRKSRSQQNPFASPEDDHTALRDGSQSLEFETDNIARRSISSASSHVFARTNSVRFGAEPSHPYGMYQQGTMARTPSVATTSTIRPHPRQSFTQNIPQHPYALYPQGVDDDLDEESDDEPVLQNPVPVGFPGLGQNYTRRFGPDGEDQDIIGEYGHAEQLPPYSRYPEDGPEKMPLLVPSALHSRAPVAGTDPGMSLMHDTLQPTRTPVPQTMTDESELARQASRASTALLAHYPSSSDESSMTSKKSWKEKTWKEKRKTRFCGIPFWWVLLSLGVLVFITAVIGGAIGGFVAGGPHGKNAAITVTTLFDASPIASPTGVTLPQGTFAISLGTPEATQCECLTVQSQGPAWDCNLAPNAALGLVVSPAPNGNGSGASVFYASYDTAISYGSQLSNMNTSYAQFIPVTDNDDPENGPAFYFQQYYDKIVVVPEYMLQPPDDHDGNNRKRQTYVGPGFMVPPAWQARRQVIPPGEKPWFCMWNNTFLEGFIYVQRPVSTSTTSSLPTPLTTNTNSATTSPSNTLSTAVTTPSPVASPDITSVLSASGYTATYAGPVSGYSAWASAQYGQAEHRRPYWDNDENYDTPHQKRQYAGADLWTTLNTFPYVVKIEERRLPNNLENPYCQQYQILNSGEANWVADDDGNPIIIELQEQDPDLSAYQIQDVDTRKHKRSGGDVPGGCHCQWMSGQ